MQYAYVTFGIAFVVHLNLIDEQINGNMYSQIENYIK